MKQKLILILSALFMSMGAWADGLKVSTTESASAEYQYKIFCRNASTYYLGNTTNATNSGADYGLFAFFEDTSGDYANGYYIYSIFEGKWVTYTAGTSYSEGKNKISLVADKPSVPWHIAADNSNNKYYDIRPFKTDDKTADTQSWNWHGGTGANTSNTMGFYSYTDGNSGWGIVLAGGSGSPVADRKVVAFFNAPKDGNLYPLYKSGTSVKISNSTETTPQYFILRQNGLDSYGEALYRIMKAECDGDYLTYQSFSTSTSNYMFLNTGSWFKAVDTRYTYSTASGHTPAEAPNYYNMFNKTGDDSYSSMVAECVDNVINRYTGAHGALPCPFDDPGSSKWNARWKVTELAGYSAWQVIMSGATSGTITYSGSALISGGTATQSNNGMFVLNAAPASSDFTTSFVEGYLSDPVITIDDKRKIIKVVYTSYTDTYNTITTALSTAPEGIGYPTTTARTRLQAAIDAFDASKTTANLATLSTQYNSFLTNVVLPEGKVYTIQNYVKSPSATTYLKNENGTLTIGADASATALNNLWVVRKSGGNYVLQSAADPTKYIVYDNFTLAATGSTWTLSCGTEWPYISMYNSTLGGGRFVACNGSNQFGTAGSGGYYGNSKTQASGWSTDFKFIENEDYKLYKVKIIYPSGSTPAVTYNEIAYSNGSDFVAPKTLKTTDLTVSSIDGYVTNVSIDGDIIYVHYNVALNNLYADAWNFDTYPWLLLNNVPAAIDNPSRTYRYNTKRINVATIYNSSVVVKFAYSTGGYRIDVAGVDLIDPSTGDVVYYDYHDGFSGSQQSNREYTINNVAPGNYILRYISYDQSTSSAGNISVWVTPYEGFYRIKGYSNNYITSNTAGSNASMNGTANKNNIVYYSSSKNIIFFANGHGMYNTHTVAPFDVTLNEYSFLPGAQAGKYYVKSDATGGIGTYCYDNTDSGKKVDRNTNPVTDSPYQTDWTLEEVTSLPVTISSVGYSTLYSPVALTIPEGVKAYTGTINNTGWLHLNEITGGVIPANTAVILKGDEDTYNFDITDDTEAIDDNVLLGSNGNVTGDGSSIYALSKPTDKEIGFYLVGDGVRVPANKAYLNISSAGVRGFKFVFDDDDATGLNSPLLTSPEKEGQVYNLAGQRISKLQKGINIINGKKVLK